MSGFEDSDYPEGEAGHKYEDTDGDVGTQLQVICNPIHSWLFVLSICFLCHSFSIILFYYFISFAFIHSFTFLFYFLFFIFSTHVLQDNSEDNNAYSGSRDTYDQNYESSGHESVALNSRSDKGIEEGEGSAPHRSSTSASTFTPVLSSASSRTGTLGANYKSGPTPYVVPSVMKTSSAAGKR